MVGAPPALACAVMGRMFDSIPDHLREWMEAQPVFFVASAPLSPDGHVNVSPKGTDSFRVLDATTAAYLDLTGSGAETIAHTRENGRLTVMFCSFGAKPNIVRLYGRGTAVLPGDERFEALATRFDERTGTRAVIYLAVERVSTSCGYSIPLMAYEGPRTTLDDWAEGKGPDGLERYRAEKNATSIDGLPALSG